MVLKFIDISDQDLLHIFELGEKFDYYNEETDYDIFEQKINK